ncbi:AraC family transcriptional regulator [Herbaspirillum lusitanum]|uniref:AraC family transcriptional regulator n=1 Tax=Herbaspirillum lusitanum TaxID=213312 RepID=A0ABW9A1N1_9BURK
MQVACPSPQSSEDRRGSVERNAAAGDWISRSPQQGSVERIEAFFHGHGYAPHRHDTYAIGRTLAGVQSFSYRRNVRHSLPGYTIVLHPDELHDGRASTDEGIRYRMVYIQPALLQQALGGSALPFVADGLSTDPRLFAASQTLLRGMQHPLAPLEQDDALLDLALALQAVGGTRSRPGKSGDFRAAQLAREYLHDQLEHSISLDRLAAVAGRDRWALTRDFRSYFGTSPYRYLTMRRLDLARRLMLQGQPLAEVAANAGFADQSHMTRQFGQAFGLPPARWLRIQRTAAR